MDVRKIETAPGLVFDASVAGGDDAPLVLMLHGFGVSRHFWKAQVPVLGEAGYFAVAPNQRGYSVGARPDPANLDSYRFDKLTGDALDLVSAVGHGDKRFHLVGHDWGASLAWAIAFQHPERTALGHHPVAAPPDVVCARAWRCRTASRSGAQAIIRRLPRTRCRAEGVGKRLGVAAQAAHERRRSEGSHRSPSVRARQRTGNGGRTGLVSRPWRADAARPDQGPDALSLGRCRRHGGARCGLRGRVNSSLHPIASRCFPASVTMPPTRCRRG